MAKLITIDPGTKSGISVWQDGLLVYAGALDYYDSKTLPLTSHTPLDVGLIEVPTIYREASKADPKNIITLAIKVGVWAQVLRTEGRCYEVRGVEPRTWKGQVPKKVHHERILAALSDHEQSICPRQPDALDAVGLGLWYLRQGGPALSRKIL